MKPVETLNLPADAIVPVDVDCTVDSTELVETVASTAPPASLRRDLMTLIKARMNFLVIVTTLLGMYMAARGSVEWMLLVHTLLGTALTAASAAVFNQIIERDHDRKMPRTRNRPLPAGRMSLGSAHCIGWLTGVVGVSWLWYAVNPLTSILGLATLVLYVFVYTPLKRTTTLNTLVGAVPGAIPPLMGYTAVANAIDLAGLSLFAILFVWQMPHFYAIAMIYRDDYAAGGYRMLPVDDPGFVNTRFHIVLWSLALLAISIAPRMLEIAGDGYLAIAMLLGTIFGGCALQLAASPTRRDARRVFFASIIYLPLLLAALTLNKL
jgi:protoheme IX farnesyltransferase